MEPLISVIVPVYKVEPYLRKCVDSILNQTYTNLEVILVDDGSPDNCGAICDEYAAKDNRITVIHKPNGGPSDARNAGMAMCKGDYLTFVDSDDWLDKRLYENVLKHHPFDISVFGCTYIYDDGNKNYSITPSNKNEYVDWSADEDRIEQLVNNSLFGYACNKIYSRSSIANIEVPSVKLREDLLFNIQAYHNTTRVLLVNNAGYFYRQRNDSILYATYHGSIPDIANVAENISEIHPSLSSEQNRKLCNRLIKCYLCDAMHKYIFKNASISKIELINALRNIFGNNAIRNILRIYPQDSTLYILLSICIKLRLPIIFYLIMKGKWHA